jgi:hypothetical protein
MPMDTMNDPWHVRSEYTYRYCFWPRRCYNTGQWLWLTQALHGSAVWHGPGEPVVEQRWYHRDEGLMMMIKGVANGNI